MIQNINLYLALPPHPKQYLASKWLGKIIISLVGLLTLIYILSYIPLIKQKSQLDQLLATKESLNAQIKAIEQIKIANAASKSAVKPKLTQFSTYFKNLAKATPNGIWLTNIKFSHLDKSLELNGYALKFEFIPNFFTNLSNLPDFLKGNISTLNLSKVEKGDKAGSVYFQFGSNVNIKTSPTKK